MSLMDELRNCGPFWDLLRGDDVYGSYGTDWFPHRTSVLTTVPADVNISKGHAFQAVPLVTQATSCNLVKDGIIPSMPDRELSDQKHSFAILRENMPACANKKVLLYNVQENFPKDMHGNQVSSADWLIDDDTVVFFQEARQSGPIRIFELFCGGYGGWTYAAPYQRIPSPKCPTCRFRF